MDIKKAVFKELVLYPAQQAVRVALRRVKSVERTEKDFAQELGQLYSTKRVWHDEDYLYILYKDLSESLKEYFSHLDNEIVGYLAEKNLFVPAVQCQFH